VSVQCVAMRVQQILARPSDHSPFTGRRESITVGCSLIIQQTRPNCTESISEASIDARER
jgi:hypothetical protein